MPKIWSSSPLRAPLARRPRGRVVGVWGASGGVGATCLGVALATRAASAGELVACVALATDDVALDAVCDRSGLPGVRWGSLEAVRGDVDGRALLDVLPRTAAGVVVLAGGRDVLDAGPAGAPGVHVESGAAGEPDDDPCAEGGTDGVADVLAGLVEVCDLVVVDAGTATTRPPVIPVPCDDAILVVAAHVPGLAKAAAVTPGWSSSGADRVWCVVRTARGRGDVADQVAEALALPLLATDYDDPAVDRDLGRGAAPGQARGGLRSCAEAALAVLERQPVSA